MPRKNPFRKKNAPPSDNHRKSQKRREPFLSQLFSSTSRASEALIPEDLLEAISPVWETTIVPTLISEFGKVPTLYAIWYAPDTPENEVIFELWDPNYVDSKPSEVFRLKGKSNITKKLPRSRSEAKVITLNNWY